MFIREIQQGCPILFVLSVLAVTPVQSDAVSGVQPFENDFGGAMRQLCPVRIGPIVLTGVAVDQSPRGDHHLGEMCIEGQVIFLISKLEIPGAKPMLVSSNMMPDCLRFLALLEVAQAARAAGPGRIGGRNGNAIIIDAGTQGRLASTRVAGRNHLAHISHAQLIQCVQHHTVSPAPNGEGAPIVFRIKRIDAGFSTFFLVIGRQIRAMEPAKEITAFDGLGSWIETFRQIATHRRCTE